MTTESKQSRPSASSSVNASITNKASQGAALRGAALAFGKPLVKPKPDTNAIKSKSNNGALAAATKANMTGSREDERIRPQPSGGSSGSSAGASELAMVRRTSGHFITDASGHLKIPREPLNRTTSPSFIAATLAASRSAPISPSHTGQQPTSPSPRHMGQQRISPSLRHIPLQPTSPSPRQTRPSSAVRSQSAVQNLSRQKGVPEDTMDISSIPSTTSLIGMFEKSGGLPLAEKTHPAIAVARARPHEIKSPKPIRTKPVYIPQEDIIFPSPKPKPKRAPRRQSESMPSTPAKTSSPLAVLSNEHDASSDDSFVSASDTRTPIPKLPPRRKQRSQSAHRAPSLPPSAKSHMTIDSLANAIVASSLASTRSRDTSPAKQTLSSTYAPPLPPPRRGNHTHNHKNSLFHHHHKDNETRTPSPAKNFRTTMRKPKNEEDEDFNMVRMGKKNLVKKHPNKHHEGDRKRWRDSITERERKRYEAVWASNRGLLLGGIRTSFAPPPRSETATSAGTAPGAEKVNMESEAVSNVVVRDIWSRSRLGEDVLAEVWELVDRTGTGKLTREEFVTGLWLIDQRLKGRKLPMRVGESVWASSGALTGIKVRRKR